MTDRELLELAAKAAGIEYGWQHIFDDYEGSTSEKWDWNPLTDDGDALRLAVKLKLDVSFGDVYYFDDGPMTFCGTHWKESTHFKRFVKHGTDPYAATRRAIVRAAAEIGKEMK